MNAAVSSFKDPKAFCNKMLRHVLNVKILNPVNSTDFPKGGLILHGAFQKKIPQFFVTANLFDVKTF